jgi:hypothetical protein
MKRFLLLLPFVFSVGCGEGGGTSLSGPSNSIPNVAGNYSGSTTMVLPEFGESVSCSTTTSVTQSGDTVNIAPFVLRGECGGMSIPVGQGRIDTTGNLAYSPTSSTTSCGVYNYVGSGGFFGRDFRFSLTATSRTCFNFNMTINLTRQ